MMSHPNQMVIHLKINLKLIATENSKPKIWSAQVKQFIDTKEWLKAEDNLLENLKLVILETHLYQALVKAI